MDSDVWVWAGIALFTLLGTGLVIWQRRRELEAVSRCDYSSSTTTEVVLELWRLYLKGRIEPLHLVKARELPQPLLLPTSLANFMICLETAVGRYREALEWRARWEVVPPDDEDDKLLRINEGEALACLGRLEDSLAWTDFTPPSTQYLRSGLAAHRGWVLAELGRVDEAMTQAAVDAGGQVLGNFEAEWHLSRFAIGFARRDWAVAGRALEQAELTAARESSRRNVHFLRGRLAFAQGDLEGALIHFERGAASPYRWQGGAALLDWGDALSRLGRGEDARLAWERCLTQDSQSPSAVIAQRRLEGSALTVIAGAK